jgi:hypothetical protein
MSGDGWQVCTDRHLLERVMTVAGSRIPGVARVKAKPDRYREGGLSVRCRATMGPGAHPGPLAADLRAALRDALDRMLGLRLNALRVELVTPASSRPLVYDLRG